MDIRAFIVCVDYWDYLSITVPYNRHHFKDVIIITHPKDTKTIQITKQFGLSLFLSESFYDNGADFNKWLPLEQAFKFYGRHGWICMMDADVLWPKKIEQSFEPGNLYTPFRRMCENFEVPFKYPPEETWARYPLHPVKEFAGYSQIFHGSDPVVQKTPWLETNWRHAGGADSFFQRKWRLANKIRPSFEALHLGPHGTNWCGRVNRFVDGSVPENANIKSKKLTDYIRIRQETRSFENEKL